MEESLYFLHNGIFWKKSRIKLRLDGSNDQILGGTLQTDIGLIFGLSVYADSVDPSNIQLITTTQATQLYLNVITGGKNYIPALRLDDLLNVYAGSPIVQNEIYRKVNIPYWAFDLNTSTISNPTLIGGATGGVASGPEVWINLYYIPKSQYNMPPLGEEGNSLQKVPAMYVKHTPVPQSETSVPVVPAAVAPNQS